MLRNRYKLFDVFGIPIYLDSSFAILLIVFVTSSGSFAIGLTAALVLAISVTAHELGHSLTARAFGYRTQDITLSLLGGCASLIALPRKAWQEFLVAIAGPLVSFAISLAVLMLDVFNIEVKDVWLCGALNYAFWLNLMLGGFNLLPGFPLDGGRVFRSFMRAFMTKAKATQVAMVVGRIVAVGIGLSGLWAVLHGGSWGFVRILIAWMIWREGYREYVMARQEESFGLWSQDDFKARVSPPPYER